MAVKIRLKRIGKKKQPSYRVVVADSRSPRDGRFIELLGRYDPKADPSIVEIDNDRALHWLQVGAQPTDAVRKLLEISGAWGQYRVARGEIHVVEPAPEPPPPKDRKSKKAAEAEAAAAEETEAAADAGEETAAEPQEAAAEPEEAVAEPEVAEEAAAEPEETVAEPEVAEEAAAEPEETVAEPEVAEEPEAAPEPEAAGAPAAKADADEESANETEES